MRVTGRAGTAAIAAVAAVAAGVALAPGHTSRTDARVIAHSHDAAVELPPSPPAGPARLVVLGDSVATGAGCDCRPFGRELAREAARLTHRRTDLSLLAHDGLTSAGLLDQVRSDPGTVTALRRATTVVVTIGANDFNSGEADSGCSGNGTACFASDLQALPAELGAALLRIRSLAGPQVQVLVTGYWNVFLDGAVAAQHGTTYQATSDALTRRVDTVLAATARTHDATYVDLYRPFRGDGDTDDTAQLASDGDHPSAAGHRLIARLLARVMAGR